MFEQDLNDQTLFTLGSEQEKPMVVTKILDKIPSWYMDRIREVLMRNKNHPILLAMRKAILAYHEADIILVRSVFKNCGYAAGPFLGIIPTRKGTRGFLLNLKALQLFPSEAKAMLERGLAHQNVRLCSLGEYVFTLKTDDFKIVIG